VIVSGHSHKPSAKQKEGVLYVNPGSAGRRRFKLPIAIGELLIDGAAVVARILELREGKFEVQHQVRAA
jgi:predicted phosphodiesterase